MSTLYEIIKRVINRGKNIDNYQEKLDLLFALGRLTETEYKELTDLLTEKLNPTTTTNE